MNDPILDAINHAEATGEGAGFTLRITMLCGTVLAGISVVTERCDLRDAIRDYRLIGDGPEADLFVSIDNVSFVTIEW